MMPQSWKIMIPNRLITLQSFHSWPALTLSGIHITICPDRTTNIAITRLTSKMTSLLHIPITVGTHITCSTTNKSFTSTLSSGHVAIVQKGKCAGDIASTVDAAFFVIGAEIPICGFAL